MNEFIIKIKAFLDAAGFTQATDSIKKVGEEVERVGEKSTKSSSKLADCIGNASALGSALGGVAVQGAEVLLHIVEKVAEKIKELALEGLKFNRVLQDSQIGIAGGFRSVDPSLGFDDAKEKGGAAIDALKQKALELGINFEALVDTFKVNIPTMWEAGVRDTQKMIDLITLLNQVAASKGIDGFQAQRDIIDLMNGMGQRTILGKELEANGVSNEAIKAAKEQGTLYELLTTKLASYGEAGKAASDTQTAALERLHTAWTALLGDFTKPFAQSVTDGLNAITESIKSIVPSTKSASQSMADFFSGIMMGIQSLSASKMPSWMERFLNFEKGGFKPITDSLGTLLTGPGELNRIQDETEAQQEKNDRKQWENFKKQKELRLHGAPINDYIPEIHDFDGLHRMDELDKKVAEQSRWNALTPEQKIPELEKQARETRDWTSNPSRTKEEADSGLKKELEITNQILQLKKQISETGSKNAAKREELDLELKIKEAKSNGDDKAAARLEWQKEYNRLLKERQAAGDTDAFNTAIRGANASIKESQPEKSEDLLEGHVSSLARMGGAMGENMQAAQQANATTKMAEHLEKITAKLDALAKIPNIAESTAAMAARQGGYQ